MYKLKDFAQDISVAIKDAQSSPFDRFVGLEHYDSGEPVITRYTDKSLLSSSVKEFRKNDILIARRNVYLKRAGIAFFDGLTSGDSIILRMYEDCESRTGISKQDAIKIIPFILNSNAFWAYANKHADGMNSKRISKEMLYDYEFVLPPLAEQKVLAEKLWAAYRLKESYKKLLAATEEMVKSQFIEMFGTINKPQYNMHEMGVICDVQRGGSPRPIKNYITDKPSGLNWIKIGDTDDSMYITKTAEKIKPSGLNKTRQVYAGDLLLSNSMSFGHPYILKIDGCIHDGWLVLHIKDESKITQLYLCAYLSQQATYSEMSKMASGGVVLNLNSEIVKKLPVILPPLEKQREYISILNQSEKSEFELRKSIDAIDAVIKSLINS